MINVRPVLNAIVSDFYQMVSLFPDFPKNMVPLIQEIEKVAVDKEILKESCPRTLNAACKNTIDSLRTKLQRIKELSLLLNTEGIISKSNDINSLSGHRLITEFDSDLEEIKGHLDNSAFLMKAGIQQKKDTYLIIKKLDELNTILSLAVVEYVPVYYKEDFRHFFFNFIHPIQQQTSKSNNFIFLNRNINSLNFAVNLLNQTLTKRKKTPEGMAPYLSVIHNRWNSLLRYYY